MATGSEKPSTGAAATLAALVALGLVGTLSAVTVLVQSATERELARKGGAVSTRAYLDLENAQRAELAEEPQWVDRQAGVLSIPIDRAMELVVEQLAQDPRSATPDPPGPSAASASPAPSTSATLPPGASIDASR